MDVRILGPLEVVTAHGPLSLPRGRARALLALLVLRAGTVVAAERLIDELWGAAPPPTANKSLHNLVAGLRRRLAAGGADVPVLATCEPGYVLRLGEDDVDANRFRRLVAEAAELDLPERSARLRAGLALWRGPALVDFAYEPFAQGDIAALGELRLAAVEERVDADLQLGRHADLVGELGGLVAEHPFRERLRAQLMLALYRCGRQADALDVYRVGRAIMGEELGLDPGPSLVALERAILEQDPALGVARSPADLAGPGTAPAEEAGAWLSAERKTVTVAYVEFVEAAGELADTELEVQGRQLARSVDIATTAVERHGGAVEGVIGGVLVAVFGIPTAHEDDALRAARAALELREAAASEEGAAAEEAGTRLAVRVGINTGEVVVGDTGLGRAAPSGRTVTLAARLQQAAEIGEILVGETTRRLLDDVATVERSATLVLERSGRPAAAWRLTGLAPATAVRTPDRSEPLIGRRAELSRLYAAFRSAVRHDRAVRCTVLGAPGIGKSRLAVELAETLDDDARVLTCRCPAYGEGITFWPLRELVAQVAAGRGRAGLAALLPGDGAAADAASIAGAVGLDDEPTTGVDLFPAVRRLLEALAQHRPLVLIVDDAHWAQPTLLELLEYLTASIRGPVLIVCLARPELQAKGRPVSGAEGLEVSLALEPLPSHDSEQLVLTRPAGRLAPDHVVRQIVALAQGNPLFIEQLLAAVREEGKLRLPASVDALLAARLDLLGPAERDLLRCAAVVGTEFSVAALRALVPVERHRFLGRHLDALQAKELIRPVRRAAPGAEVFAFQHGLLQQAAYRSTTREVRGELHRELADWLEQTGAPELEEVLAYHLERAYEERRQLGDTGEATNALAVRAGERLAATGLRAYRRFDMTAAANLLERARRLLPRDHARRYDVLRRLSQAYPTLGRLADADAVLAEMLEAPEEGEDPRHEHRLRLEQLRVRVIAGPDPVPHTVIRAEVRGAMAALEPLGDDVGMSEACYLLAMLHLREGDVDGLLEVGRRGLAYARRSGDLREELAATWWPSWAVVDGTTPVDEAITACEDLLRGGEIAHVGVLTDLARLTAMQGAFDEARALVERARQVVSERIRVRRPQTVVAQRAAEVEVLAGELGAAERVLRAGLEVALDVGERERTAMLAGELSRVLALRAAAEESAALASLSREQAPAESVTAQALWRAASALAGALEGEADGAERLAREAVAVAPSGLLNFRAERHLDLAAVLSALGRGEAASAAARAAAGLYERKGNVAGRRLADARSAELDTATP